jgi:GTP-binding protein
MLIDHVTVRVVAGTGGSGASSFARFKYKPKGGPDGGDGGHGGTIYLRGDANLATLLDYRYRTTWKAERGQHGMGKSKTGASADDLYLPVPPGTEVRDADSGEWIGEVLHDGDTLLVAKGGRGGRGNSRFATPTHQAPREWEPGEEGEERNIELLLKLIADVGLVGEPNAGKSTLLSVISAARPKIADYPFTTLEPNLGVVQLSGHRTFVCADIPGIIEGASAGKGLGLKFLQHVERTRVLAFLVPVDAEDPQGVYDGLRAEVRAYSETLAAKPHVVLLTKRDLLPDDAEPTPVDAPEAAGILAVSSAAGTGLESLKEYLWKFVEEEKRVVAETEGRRAAAAEGRISGSAHGITGAGVMGGGEEWDDTALDEEFDLHAPPPAVAPDQEDLLDVDEEP